MLQLCLEQYLDVQRLTFKSQAALTLLWGHC